MEKHLNNSILACVRESKRARVGIVCTCVYVCVCTRERERARDRARAVYGGGFAIYPFY